MRFELLRAETCTKTGDDVMSMQEALRDGFGGDIGYDIHHAMKSVLCLLPSGHGLVRVGILSSESIRKRLEQYRVSLLTHRFTVIDNKVQIIELKGH